MKITSSGDVTIIIGADDQTKEAIEAAKQRLGQLGSHTESTLSKMKSQWLTIVGVLYTVKKAYDWMQEGANYQAQMNQMDALARKHNETAESILNDLRKITDGEIANADLIAVSAETMLKGLNPDQIKEFAKYADGLGKTLGIDDVAAFRAMTDAAISGKGAWKLGAMEAKDLDSVLGSQVNTMSDVEKAQARVTLMLKLMKQEFGQTSQEVKAASDIYDQVNAKLSNLWMSIKNFIAKYGVMVIAGWALITSVFNQGISNMLYGAEKLLNFVASLPGHSSLLKILFGGVDPKQAINHIGNLAKSFHDTAYNAEKFALSAYESWKNYDKFSGSVKVGTGHINNNTKAMQELASAQAQWNSKVEALNPFIDAEDKQVIALTQSMNELIQKYGNAKWIYEGYAKAITYMDYSEAMKQNEARQKLIDEENKYTEEKYAETLKKMEELDKQAIEIKKTQYEQAWKSMFETANIQGGEMGKASGQMLAGLKGLDDIDKGIDPYTQQLDRLTQYYSDRTAVMEQQMNYELEYGDMKIATELEREQYKQEQLALIQDQWNQYKSERTAIAAQQDVSIQIAYLQLLQGAWEIYCSFYDKKSKAMFLIGKALSIAMIYLHGLQAAMGAASAVASVPYVGPILATAQLAKWMTITYLQMALAAAAALTQMATQGSSGSSSGGGGYSYSNPSTSTWESSEASKQVSSKSVEIHIHGNVVDHAAFARELAPYISEAKGDKVSYGEQ